MQRRTAQPATTTVPAQGDRGDATPVFDEDKIRAHDKKEIWRFFIYLNRHAVNALVSDPVKYIPKIAAKLSGPCIPIFTVGMALPGRIGWTKKAAGEGGAYVTGTWAIPGALVPFAWDDGEGKVDPPQPPKYEDTQLWLGVFDQGDKTWGEVRRLGPYRSAVSPGVTWGGGENTVHVVHRGTGGDTQLYHTVSSLRSDRYIFSEAKPIPGTSCATTSPTLVSGSPMATCYYRDASTDKVMWTEIKEYKIDKNEWTWTTPKEIPGATTAGRVAVSSPVWGARDVVFFRGAGSDEQLYYIIASDGKRTSWGAVKKVTDVSSAAGPGVIGFEKKVDLVYRGAGSDTALRIVSTSDIFTETVTWTSPSSLGASSSDSPALQRQEVKNLGDSLGVFYRGTDDDQIRVVYRTKGTWGSPRVMDGHMSASGPSVARVIVVAQPEGRPQDLLVHRGHQPK